MEIFLQLFVLEMKVIFSYTEILLSSMFCLDLPTHICSDYWFGILTTLFIFLPSCNALSAFYGPSTAATLCSIWGDILMVIGICIWCFASTNFGGIFSWLLFLLGAGLVLLGSIGKEKNAEAKSGWIQQIKNFLDLRLLQFLSFPIAILISPFLIILVKVLHILMPKNKFIEKQMKCAGIR